MTSMNYVVAHWSAAWPVLVCYAAIVGVHLTGLRRLTVVGRTPGVALAGDRQEGRRREAVIFHVGLFEAFLALVSPIAYWSGEYIWVRSVQDLVLGVVAPSLVVLGAPWLALRQGLPGANARRPDDEPTLGNGHATAGRFPWWLAWPVGATVAFNIVWLGWHVPALYDLAAREAVAGYAESVMYPVAGILFWLQLIGSWPWTPRSPPLRRLALLVGTAAADTVLGMVLVFGAGLDYGAYRGPAHHVFAVVADQQVGGAVLWMGMLPSFVIAAVALLNTWLKNEESDDLSADLERLTGQRAAGRSGGVWSAGSAWAGRPGSRRRTI
jgi:putative membrane protein